MNKHKVNSFSNHQAYTIKDMVRILDSNERSVSRWVGQGLVPIQPNSKPLYFMGGDIKQFFNQSKKRKKCPLKRHQFWCSKCRKASSAKEKSIVVIGNRRSALCKDCGGKINRYIGKETVKIRAP